MKKFIALLMGSMTDAPTQPDEATMARGMAAWSQWMADHAGAVEDGGGPVGKTKLIGPGGISDTRNAVSGFLVVRAEDHAAAARLFENHPHFSIFPGTGVEVMEVLPIPGR
ncbi:MAG: hypothetical protein JWO33_2110 [Caulobacteraceae bacterium]|nr:hypothetical protein [Caulobacteraceae bacterium]